MITKILSIMLFATLCVACGKKENSAETQSTTTTQNIDTIATATSSGESSKFACSMHPEITGSKGEACSKCGMDLTVAVAE